MQLESDVLEKYLSRLQVLFTDNKTKIRKADYKEIEEIFDKLYQKNLFTNIFVLLENGTIYETNELLTYNFSVSSSGGYLFNIEKDHLYMTTSYLDPEAESFESADFITDEEEDLGQVIQISNDLQSFLKPGYYLTKISDLSFKLEKINK